MTGSGTASLRDTRSAEVYARALTRLPGGVNSPVRAMRAIGRTPIFVERAAGAEIVDVDGNRYVDWVCSWGPLILGHAEPGVVAAVTDAAARASRIALIDASVPEEVIRSISTDGIRWATTSASSTSAAVGAQNVVPRSAAACTASRTGGNAWPWISGPQEQT